MKFADNIVQGVGFAQEFTCKTLSRVGSLCARVQLLEHQTLPSGHQGIDANPSTSRKHLHVHIEEDGCALSRIVKANFGVF